MKYLDSNGVWQHIPTIEGYSPQAKVERVSDGVVITITDKDGTTTAKVNDGSGGSGGGGLSILVVDSLPTSDISTSVIYFVPNTDDEVENFYDEYMYINGNWEIIGAINRGTLTLGSYKYNGTENVDVPVYDGGYSG